MFAPYAGRPDLSFLEIGSFEGRSACWLLSNILTHPTARLVCVDQFILSEQQHGILVQLGVSEDLERDIGARFRANIDAIGAAARVEALSGRSVDILRTLPRNAFDVVYVDGSHLAPDVLSDAVLCWPLLKADGLLIFDDYDLRLLGLEKPTLHPKLGIDAFCAAFADHLDILSSGAQLVCRKRPAVPANELETMLRVINGESVVP